MALFSHRTLTRAVAVGLVLGGLALAAPASAQRDPAYQAARAAGQVGEKTDGYLGVVGNQSAEIRRMVDELNILRRQNYTERARAQGATIEEYAITQGCILISRTVAGERYQAPDGSWQTRGAGAPQLHSRCPA